MTEPTIRPAEEERDLDESAEMTERDQQPSETPESMPEEEPEAETTSAAKPKMDPVRKATLIVIAVILVLLCWYLRLCQNYVLSLCLHSMYGASCDLCQCVLQHPISLQLLQVLSLFSRL